MAPIKGVNVPSLIVPFTDSDQYPVIDPNYGIGGWREVPDIGTRDAIPAPRLRAGMMVYVQGDKPYLYTGSGWTGISFSTTFDASAITTGKVALARGGTNADLSATGGASQVLKQVSSGAAITVGQLSNTDIAGLSTMATQNASAVAITGGSITGMSTPTASSDVATKGYVDSVVSGLSVRDSVAAASTGALASNVYNNGASGVGATLTASSNGALVLDGYTVAVSDRLLIKDEATASHNGIYSVTQTGNGSQPYILTRVVDANSAASIFSGIFVFVETGTVNGGGGFVLTTTGAITVGTTGLTFTQFSGAGEITAGTGITKSGNTLSLANPSSSTIGGVQSLAAVTSKWIDSISTSGVPHASQPAFSDISGTATSGQIPSLDASKITTGTLALARGGVNADLSATGGTSQVLKQTSSGAAITVGQLAASDLSNGTSGSGAVALVSSPSFTTPTLGAATATTINKVTITQPSSAATLTIANNKTFTVNNILTLAGTDSTTITFQGTDTYVGRATTDTLTGKTIDTSGSGNHIQIAGHDLPTSIGSSGQTLGNSSGSLAFVSRTAAITYVIDGGGSTPSTGAKGQINIPIACTVTGWVITADASGSAVVDVLRSAYSGFPSTSSIAGSDKPTLSSAQKNENLGPLSGWGSTSLLAGDQLQFNLNSVTTCQRINITLNVTIP